MLLLPTLYPLHAGIKMIDLHTHTFFSDGELLPSELVYRAKNAGYDAIAITDHCDFSNMDFVIKRIKTITAELKQHYNITVLAGCELTYVPPKLISKAVKKARQLGAKIVVVHGESPVEPVPTGTNRAAILAKCDILAHPGFISEDDAKLAKKMNIPLEITTRNGHKKGNAHVAKIAKKTGVKLVMNTDSHSPENLFSEKLIKNILKEAGLSMNDFKIMQRNSYNLLK